MCFVSGTFANRKWLLLGHHVASYWLIVAFRLLFDCHNVAGCLCLDANDDVSVARTFDWHLCVRLAPLSNLRPANCGSNSTGVTTCLLSISNTEKKNQEFKSIYYGPWFISGGRFICMAFSFFFNLPPVFCRSMKQRLKRRHLLSAVIVPLALNWPPLCSRQRCRCVPSRTDSVDVTAQSR